MEDFEAIPYWGKIMVVFSSGKQERRWFTLNEEATRVEDQSKQVFERKEMRSWAILGNSIIIKSVEEGKDCY